MMSLTIICTNGYALSLDYFQGTSANYFIGRFCAGEITGWSYQNIGYTINVSVALDEGLSTQLS
jgi:hypothetical protein